MKEHLPLSPYCMPGLMPGYTLPGRTYNQTRIILHVSEYYKVPITAMINKTRAHPVVEARQIAMYFLRSMTSMTLKEIGQLFGGRDHTNAIHSCNTVRDLMQTDEHYMARLQQVSNRIISGDNGRG